MTSGVYKRTTEYLKKRSKMAKEKGWKPPSRLDIKTSEETKRKLRKPKPNFCGKNNPAWKGGKSFEPYSVDWTKTLKESIRQRDRYICQECGIHQDELYGWLRKLDIHHIDYNKKNLNQDNLITLCRSCHQKTNFNRDYWLDYFTKK